MQVLFLLSQSLSRDRQKGNRASAQEPAIKCTSHTLEQGMTPLRPAKISVKPEKLQKRMTM